MLKPLVIPPTPPPVESNGHARRPPSSWRRETPGRSAALDAVKGLLVLLMILYHWLNYFVTVDSAVYRYLRFITPSFIFITGFLITHVYLTKYPRGGRGLHGRLLMRGLKLLGLFTALNLLAGLALTANYEGSPLSLRQFAANALAIYVSGDGRGAAFEVLIPIGYLLAASSLLLWTGKFQRSVLIGVWMLGVGGVYLLKWKNMGSANVELITMGCLGMVAGCFALELVDRVTRPAALWIGAYAVYLVALSVYDVIFELQVLGLILNMALLYLMARRIGATGAIPSQIVLLGQYSLLAYIAHIVVLQFLARALRPVGVGVSLSAAALAGVLVLTLLVVQGTRWARGRSSLLDRFYRLVFA